ncbi:hypothetical protein BD770DRAFT_407614 [Pilaira anomala]|nr:hypothetical protein BD770DRAFT_407614 [Pilaira anomala]
MSLKPPKLRKLLLQYYDSSDEEEDGSPITINMPNTNFDLLHWEHLEAYTDIDDTFAAYISYYKKNIINLGLFPIKIKQYRQVIILLHKHLSKLSVYVFLIWITSYPQGCSFWFSLLSMCQTVDIFIYVKQNNQEMT